MLSKSPKLWLVATPIGNPGDLSDRARDVLSAADVICAEDTRQAGLFCKRQGIVKARFCSVFEHNEQERIQRVLGFLRQGLEVALMSTAGSPLIADPGYQLVRSCRHHGFPVSPVPGPSAPIAALTASGLPPYPFTFLGFLPRKAGDQHRTLAPFASLKSTLVFFERKSRLHSTLNNVLQALGDREACLCRELTKPYEEFIPFRLAGMQSLASGFLGELTVVVGPPESPAASSAEEVERLIQKHRQAGSRPKETVQAVLRETAGWDRKSVYRLYTQIQRDAC